MCVYLINQLSIPIESSHTWLNSIRATTRRLEIGTAAGSVSFAWLEAFFVQSYTGLSNPKRIIPVDIFTETTGLLASGYTVSISMQLGAWYQERDCSNGNPPMDGNLYVPF